MFNMGYTIIVMSVCQQTLENSASELIISYCQKNQLPFVGKIPYDENAVEAIDSGPSIIDILCLSGEAVKEVYKKTILQLINN